MTLALISTPSFKGCSPWGGKGRSHWLMAPGVAWKLIWVLASISSLQVRESVRRFLVMKGREAESQKCGAPWELGHGS